MEKTVFLVCELDPSTNKPTAYYSASTSSTGLLEPDLQSANIFYNRGDARSVMGTVQVNNPGKEMSVIPAKITLSLMDG